MDEPKTLTVPEGRKALLRPGQKCLVRSRKARGHPNDQDRAIAPGASGRTGADADNCKCKEGIREL
jgi:hypothetical protein